MEHELPRHEKIRFRRHEITDLATLPSAAELHPELNRPRRQGRLRSVLLGALAALISLPVLAILVVYAVATFGIDSETLSTEAEKAAEAFTGVEIDAAAGPVRITFDKSRFLALEVRDLKLRRAADGTELANAGLVRFGVRFLPLLTGNIQLSSAELSNARIAAGVMPEAGGTDWSDALRNAEGLIDPDLVLTAVFTGVHRALDAVDQGSARSIALDDVEFILPPASGIANVRVIDAELSEAGSGRLSLSAEVAIDGRTVAIDAAASRDDATGRILGLEVSARTQAADASSSAAGEKTATTGNRIGAAELKLSGFEGADPEAARLDVALKLEDSALDLGTRGVLSGDLDVAGKLLAGSDRIEIERLDTTVGRTVLRFRGVIGPRPPSGQAGDKPAYRYNLVSERSTLAPAGSPEPALESSLRLRGVFLAGEGNLIADEIVVRSGRGEVLGTASVRFVEGKSPGIAAAFSVQDMPVSHVKQLWPWFSARNAREWVLANLFGGRVVDARLHYQVEPGRMGNGVPLSAQEVFGTFAIEGTRFDTAGLIPPVRDAVGLVDFRGNDVDIALTSGTVFLPSGRTVAASNGKLTVKDAHVAPVIGALDIDVAGDAPAVAELASYDPINAMRFIGLTAEDFAGQISGNVKADIPLQKGIKTKLGWTVALDYRNLSIAKPVDGQMVTDAEGKITVFPEKAVIAAKARLSGVPAQIDAIEPFEGKAERERTVTLVLDDKAREAFVPGISNLVKGKVEVKLDVRDGKRKIEADLTDAELSIPWAGWSKGPGIAAAVSFFLENEGEQSVLSDFDLTGKSFGLKGSVALSNGALQLARFSSVRLNRGDDVAVTVKRTGKGFAVDISGEALDARSIVKQFTADTSTATKAADTGTVSVSADVKSLTGFHGAQLSNVDLKYSGSGDRVIGLDITATTSSGQTVEIRNGSENGGRSMRMRSTDAGALLKFLDIYEHMEGGSIDLSLAGGADGPMSGRVDARDFWVVDEPRLKSLVSAKAPGDDMSLSEAVKRDIDTSRVKFERGFTQIEKGDGHLRLANGVLRGPLLGFSFQGTLYDKAGNMDMTGTFMPAYGLNRIFGEIPLFGILLGNGRDGGLIGVTFKLAGDADSPELQINPLSIIAPGIFRSIFEFR